MNPASKLLLITTISSLSSACIPDGAETNQAPALSQSWESFQANPPVRWETFRASVQREPSAPHRFVVDGDVPLETEAELRAFYDGWLAQEYRATVSSASALTVQTKLGADTIWPAAQKTSLTYCVSGLFDYSKKSELLNALAQAAASWRAIANVQFIYRNQEMACTDTNPNVVFNVTPLDPGAGFLALAFYPDATRANRRLQISPAAFSTTAGGRDLQGILRHELGHILGFRHEHSNINCESHPEDITNQRLVTSYDVNSVMHYPECRPSGTGGYRQSPLDEIGATILYGAPRTTECLFDHAQISFPTLFTPAAATQVSGTFVYRYYPGTGMYLGINVMDQNVYFQAPGGTPQSQGTKAHWLTSTGCN